MSPNRSPVDLSRAQILAFRRRTGGLDGRQAHSPTSLRHAAWVGLQDSMPRAALLSLYARVAGIGPSAWEDPTLVQLWGPRYSAYVVPRRDVALFSLGRVGENERALRRAEDMADRIDAFLDGRVLSATEIGRGLGIHANALRYAAPAGRVLIRWDGSRQPTVWTVPAPGMDPGEAQLELARRYLHVFGPTTPAAFSQWAGIKPPRGDAAFQALAPSLIRVRTSIGDGWILEQDEAGFRASDNGGGHSVRLLPSGDPYYLLQGSDRELLVPDAARRSGLWTSRVWPGAVLVGDEIAAIWRRAGPVVTVETWRRLSRAERESVELEAAAMPLPGIDRPVVVRWQDRAAAEG